MSMKSWVTAGLNSARLTRIKFIPSADRTAVLYLHHFDWEEWNECTAQ
jgi:hypothetical protein